METPQVRTPKLRHKREVKLGLAPSSDFRWFSSILHRKRTAIVPHPGQLHSEWEAPGRDARARSRQPEQDHGTAVEATPPGHQLRAPATTPLIGEEISSGVHANHTDTESRALPDMASAESSAVAEKIKMKLPESEPAQPGLHLAPLTAASQAKRTSELHPVWDEKIPHQPGGLEQVGTRQKQGTALDMEAPLNETPKRYLYLGESSNDNPKSDDSRIRNPKSGISQKESSRNTVSREREGEELQPEHSEWAKEHVWQILRHQLRGAEGITGSVVVEAGPCGTQQMLVVKCCGPAAARARDTRKLLEKTKRGLASQGFILSVAEETRVGTDFSLLWGPGPSDNISPGANMHTADRTLVPDYGEWYESVLPSRQGQADRFANIPFWNSTSILVDCLFPPRPQLLTNTLCGALVKMMSWEYQGESQLRTWTCGGIVNVNGVPYALTTAHPLITNHRGKEQDGVGATKSSVIDDVFPAEYGPFFEGRSNRTDWTHSWQTLGRVYKHAMSSDDRVPANYDWLLIEISKDYLLPNSPAGYDRDGGLGEQSGPNSPAGYDRDGGLEEQSGDPGSVSICTWRGSLQATPLPGLSFMILGHSSFKAIKLSVDQPMGGSAPPFDVQLVLQLIEYSARRLRFMGLQR